MTNGNHAMYAEYPATHPWLVLAPVLGLAAAVLVHYLFARLTGGTRAYGCALRGFWAGGVVTLYVSIYGMLWPPLRIYEMDLKTYGGRFYMLDHQDLPLEIMFAHLLFNLVIYAALGFCYVNFVGLSIASLRIRILQELLAHPEGLSQEKILASYNPTVLIDNRIDRLTSGRQLVEKEERFRIGRRGILWAARIMDFMKRIVLGRRRSIP